MGWILEPRGAVLGLYQGYLGLYPRELGVRQDPGARWSGSGHLGVGLGVHPGRYLIILQFGTPGRNPPQAPQAPRPPWDSWIRDTWGVPRIWSIYRGIPIPLRIDLTMKSSKNTVFQWSQIPLQKPRFWRVPEYSWGVSGPAPPRNPRGPPGARAPGPGTPGGLLPRASRPPRPPYRTLAGPIEAWRGLKLHT